MPVLIQFSAVGPNNVKEEYFEALYDSNAEDQLSATKSWIQYHTKHTSSNSIPTKDLDISNYKFTNITANEFAILYNLFGGTYGYTSFNN